MISWLTSKSATQILQSSGTWGKCGLRTSTLRKPNLSSLTKHLKPDGLKGYQRRARLKEAIRTKTRPVSEQTRGHIPVRFRLGAVVSDVKVAQRTRPGKAKSNGEKVRNTERTGDGNAKGKDSVFFQPGSKGKSMKEMTKEAKGATISSIETNSTLPIVDLPIREALSSTTVSLVQESLPNGSPLRDDPGLLATPIQSSAVPTLLDLGPKGLGRSQDGRHFILAAETGTGKTLAYLLPVGQDEGEIG
ncbi:hypothetical protein BJ684DRAFT_14893, partial [Piptocephalis cylindrospora]